MKKLILLPLFIFSITLFSCKKDNSTNPEPETEAETEVPIEGPVAVTKTNPMKVYVHYMPWFETPETSDDGTWGLHWKLANKNPDLIDNEGKREIASHFYPSIGPYATNDKDVIEYHLLLMKYAGIDGLIVDWYGSFNLWDFPSNRRNTEAVINKLDAVGLSFAITYEDWTLNSIVENGLADTQIDAAIADLKYLETNYFSKNSYVKINENPLLTVFGPQTIQNTDDWTTILQSISKKPALFSLWFESNDMGENAMGEFAWVYEDNTHISNFYNNRIKTLELGIGSAYPGFKDFYEEGEWGGAKDWEIGHNNGATFDATLAMASNANIDYLQLVTWNDFGEGTMIEPTLEFEYMFLEKLQEFTGVTYKKDVFEYILKLYKLRKSKADDSNSQTELDKAFNHLVKLEVEEAKIIIDTMK